MHPRCAGCGAPFIPEPRAAGRQRFCSRPECRRRSKHDSQRRWKGAPLNHSYHSGEVAAHRVREWRKSHPGYWRRGTGTVDGQDTKIYDLRAVLVEFALGDSCGALQDVWPPQLVALVGVIARWGGDALQETIARDLREIMLEGNAILSALLPSTFPRNIPSSQEST